MKKHLALVLALLLTLCLFAGTLTAFAEGDPWSEDYYRAADLSETLSEAERNELDKTCIELMKKHRLDLALIAVPEEMLDGDSLEDVAEYFYESSGFGYGSGRDGFSAAVNTDTHETVIRPFGAAAERLPAEDLTYIAESVPKYLEEHGIFGGLYAIARFLDLRLENAASGGSSGAPIDRSEIDVPLRADGLPSWYPDDPQSFQFFHDPNAPRVVDRADLFDEAAERRMEARLAEIRSAIGRDIVICTDTTSYGKSHMAFADDFFDYNGYGIGDDYEGMCLFICMDPSDRGWWVSCSGPDTMGLYTEEYANDMDDVLYEYMSTGSYTEGVEDWIENAYTLYTKGAPFAPEWYPDRGAPSERFHDAAAARVVDDAAVLTEAEQADLTAKAAALSAKYGIDVVIHTASGSYGMPRQAYADSFYRYLGYGLGDGYDGIGLVVFKSSGRVCIVGEGAGTQKLTDVNRERLTDRTESLSTEKDFYGACSQWLDLVDHMQRTGRVPKSTASWILSAIGSFLTGGLGGLISTGSAKRRMASPRQQLDANAYLVAEGLTIQDLGEEFLHTTSSRRYVPVRTSSGGGSGHSSYSSSHHSSSGRSHSGSGRHF